jgi:hypothetical protein
MFKLSKNELRLLASLESVDSISVGAFCDEIHLHKGKSVGMYIEDHGVVLEPIYAEIKRFEDILKVGIRKENGFLLFGGYSINKKEFVIPIMYTDREFWEQFSSYRNS